MNIDEKLALSSRENIVTFIREGMFYRCYQQTLSAYPAHLSGNVNILHKQVKCLMVFMFSTEAFPKTGYHLYQTK